MTNQKLIPVIVEDKHRYVGFGYTEDPDATPIKLVNARVITYWGTTGGVCQLALEGPQEATRLGSVAPKQTLREPARVYELTDEVGQKFMDRKTYGK